MELDLQNTVFTGKDIPNGEPSTPLPANTYSSESQFNVATGALVPTSPRPEYNEPTPFALIANQESLLEREALDPGTVSEAQVPWEMLTEHFKEHVPEPSTYELAAHDLSV